MTERERLVEDVVKASDSVVARWRKDYGKALPQYNRALNEEPQALWNAIDALRAHDAAPKPLKWGCRVVKGDEDYLYPYAIDSADGKYSLGGNGWYEIVNRRGCLNFESESAALAALDACTTPPRGYVEPTDDLLAADNARADAKRASEYRTVTDPQEIRAVLDRLPVGAPANVWGKLAGPFSGRIGRLHNGQAVVRCDGTGEWRESIVRLDYRLSDDPQATPAGETPSLASRVAELERQLAHESRCRIVLDGGMESMHLRFTDQIAALRRDVDGLGERVGALIIDVDTIKATTPAPTEPLPFGCVARQKADLNWQIENAAGTYWWSNTPGEGWLSENIDVATNRTLHSAVSKFIATNGGKVPPPDHKPASEGRYEVVPHSDFPDCDVVMRNGHAYNTETTKFHRHSIEGTPFRRTDGEKVSAIALAVRDALEARNA